MDEKQAESLWSDLRDAFVNAERKIKEIIEAKAWEPLGYDTFAEAWNDRMAGVRLATDAARAHVVYALFDDGASDEQVYETVGGIGSGVTPDAIKTLKRQKSNGVPVNRATTRVKSHDRERPTAPKTVRVELTPDEFDQYKTVVKRLNLDLADEAGKALRAHFRKLERARA